jgi:hypothetical protein
MRQLEFYVMLHHDFLTQASLVLGRKQSTTVEFQPSEKEIRERYMTFLLKAAQVAKFIRKLKKRNGSFSNTAVL